MRKTLLSPGERFVSQPAVNWKKKKQNITHCTEQTQKPKVWRCLGGCWWQGQILKYIFWNMFFVCVFLYLRSHKLRYFFYYTSIVNILFFKYFFRTAFAVYPCRHGKQCIWIVQWHHSLICKCNLLLCFLIWYHTWKYFFLFWLHNFYNVFWRFSDC